MSQTYPIAMPVVDGSTTGVVSRRFLAFLVDCVLMAIIGWAAAFFILIFGILTLGLGLLMFHILPFVPLLYYTGLIGTAGATPGQRMLGLVTRQDATGAQPNLAQALVWAILLHVSFVLGGLPFLLALVGPRHRAAHDMLAGLTIFRRV